MADVGTGIKIFIGSSTKTKDRVTMVTSWLQEMDFTVWRWFDPSVFLAGHFIFPRLVEIANQVDAAVFVMGDDDDLWYRQDSTPKPIPRDNVLIEYGLFSGVLNAAQVIICRVGSPKMAVDLGGLVYIDLKDDQLARAEIQVKEWAKQLKRRSGLLLTEPMFAQFGKEFPNLADMLVAFAHDEPNWPARSVALQKAAKLYSFAGLQCDLREDDVFQDFRIDRAGGANINAVQFFWADTLVPDGKAGEAGSVNAWLVPQDSCLRVKFTSLSPWPSNIGIRARDERPLLNAKGWRHLSFEARVAPGQPKVALTVRLVNGWLQHWEYRTKSGAPTVFTVVDNGEFQRFAVDLGDLVRWNRFGADGNHICGPTQADFNIVTGVVLELGSPNPGSRPGAGQGLIDIRDIRLAD